MHRCAGLPEPLLFVYVINIPFTWTTVPQIKHGSYLGDLSSVLQETDQVVFHNFYMSP